MSHPPPTIATNRKDIVSIISNFHTFLTTHPFLPASAIKTPPSEGWPEEYCSIFRKMSKSPQVIHLLSHLPYIDSATWEWFHDTKPINYISALNLKRINEDWEGKRYLFEPMGQRLGENVVSLTDGRVYGVWVLLDVEAGTITEYSVYGSPASQVSEDQLESDEVWRFYPTMPIGDFFEKWIEKMQGGGSSR